MWAAVLLTAMLSQTDGASIVVKGNHEEPDSASQNDYLKLSITTQTSKVLVGQTTSLLVEVTNTNNKTIAIPDLQSPYFTIRCRRPSDQEWLPSSVVKLRSGVGSSNRFALTEKSEGVVLRLRPANTLRRTVVPQFVHGRKTLERYESDSLFESPGIYEIEATYSPPKLPPLISRVSVVVTSPPQSEAGFAECLRLSEKVRLHIDGVEWSRESGEANASYSIIDAMAKRTSYEPYWELAAARDLVGRAGGRLRSVNKSIRAERFTDLLRLDVAKQIEHVMVMAAHPHRTRQERAEVIVQLVESAAPELQRASWIAGLMVAGESEKAEALKRLEKCLAVPEFALRSEAVLLKYLILIDNNDPAAEQVREVLNAEFGSSFDWLEYQAEILSRDQWVEYRTSSKS